MEKSTQEIYEVLKAELIDLHIHWIMYKQLFAKDEETLELLNQSGSNVFYILQQRIYDHMILQLSKLTDRATTLGSPNLSLEQLMNNIADTELKDDMLDKYKVLCDRLDDFKKIRHKKIAHVDLSVALKEQSLPGISRNNIDECLQLIRELMNCVELFYFNNQIIYEETILKLGSDGATLISRLKKALAYDNLEKADKIERRFWRKF